MNQLQSQLIQALGTDAMELKSYSSTVDPMEISLKYNQGIAVDVGTEDNTDLVMVMNANMMQLGFIMSEDLSTAVATMTTSDITVLYEGLITELKKMKGAHVTHSPMYNNFPQEVMSMNHLELFINAISHYWTAGRWKPESPIIARAFAFENHKFITIGLSSKEDFAGIFTKLVTSNDSISESDRDTVIWFLDYMVDVPIPTDMPFKENMCVVAGYMLERDYDVSPFVKTTTDVLRIATYLSDGDISLATNTKFKKFPRPMRRKLIALLEPVISAEDVNRHRNKWVKLFHGLHVGDYSTKIYDVAKTFRENKRVVTFNTRIEAALKTKDINTAVSLLVTRPGDFARRIDHLLRITSRKKGAIIDAFLAVACDVDTRVLSQLLGNLKIRNKVNTHKIVFPKGNVQRAIKVDKITDKLSTVMVNKLANGIIDVLEKRFSELEDMGKVWIDPQLDGCPLPTQQRSASDSLFTVGRGTKLPFTGDKNTLRMFIYWKGQDIDLSATLYDENFKLVEQVSYTRLKSEGFQACHSGDITRAPNGASEFIDITIAEAVARGARYVAMNVLVYTGPTFAEHEECFAGWMTRDTPRSNEIYDAKTVEQKIDLRNDTKNCIPVIFDLVERKAIWADLATKRNCGFGGNNVESNRATIEETVEAIVTMKNKLSLYELFLLHARSRGELVDNKEDADIVFSMYEGITPYHIPTINSEYLV